MRSDISEAREALLSAIAALPLRGKVKLMEVCGTHTMAIAKSGIKSMLPENVQLLSGPGCPVCVTPAAASVSPARPGITARPSCWRAPA